MKRERKSKRSGIVTLITDFGLGGEYSGAMKGAVLSVNPLCQVIDITHQINPQHILQAAFVLKNTYSYYPAGTVHVVVVDPGVGTSRRPVVLEKDGHLFVGPDNGVFTLVLTQRGKTTGYEISRGKYFHASPSDTFHGRDIFAPVAGHLSEGLPAEAVGPPVERWMKVSWPQPRVVGRRIRGQVLWADSFGNLITNISRTRFGPLFKGSPFRIKGPGWRIDRVHRTYGEGSPGQPMALFGSTGFLEIALNQGNALDSLGLAPGDSVTFFLL